MRRLTCLTLVFLLPLSTRAWRAYNDLCYTNGQTTAANVTKYTSDRGNGSIYQMFGNSGPLIDFDTGTNLSVTVTVTGAGPAIPAQGSSTLNGDAAMYFAGIVDCKGNYSYGTPATNHTMHFYNLDPGEQYSLVYYVNRGSYTTRRVLGTLQGADSFINSSSAGIVYSGPYDPSARQMNTINTTEGYVMHWSMISPGSDGQIALSVEDNRSAASNYPYGSAFMIQTQPPPFVRVQVAASEDDAEERLDTGAVDLTSSDLELIRDATNLVVGMRFSDIQILQAVTVTAAYVQFTANEVQSNAVSLTIWGQAADNAPAFTTAAGNISSRPTTTNSVVWNPPDWNTVDEAGPAQRTPDISPVIQEIIGRPGWDLGAAIVLLVKGPGDTANKRTARSWNQGTHSMGPILHIEYVGATPDAGTLIQISATEPLTHGPPAPVIPR